MQLCRFPTTDFVDFAASSLNFSKAAFFMRISFIHAIQKRFLLCEEIYDKAQILVLFYSMPRCSGNYKL